MGNGRDNAQFGQFTRQVAVDFGQAFNITLLVFRDFTHEIQTSSAGYAR